MGFINEILEKNLSCIKKYDEELSRKIAAIDSLSLPLQVVYTDLNEPNLAINGVPLNAQTGAQAEAEAKVKAFSHNNQSSIHIVFGAGFGYIFKQAAEFSKGTVILYEPEIELLRVMLEMVDLSDILSRPRVFVANNLNMLEKHFCAMFMSGSQTALTFTNYHKLYLKAEFDSLLKKLGVLQGIMSANENQRAELGFGYANDVIKNLPRLLKCNSVNVLKDVFKGVPAVIAASGPSLGENLETIKKYRDKFLLFGVSTSYNSLIQNGITPDFVSMIERFDASGFVRDNSPENVCLIAEPYVSESVLEVNFKNKFITSSCENTANKIYEKGCNASNDGFETKGTVAYNALFAAKYAGCNPIILVGQDLAYIDGECYSKNSPLSEIKCRKTQSGWEVYVENCERLIQNLYGHIENSCIEKYEEEIERKIEELNNGLAVVKSKSGNEVATSVVFALFAEYYRSFASKYAHEVKLYTVSQKGANIGDFEYKPLEEIVKDFPDIERSDFDKITKSVPDCEINNQFLENEYELLCEARSEMYAAYSDFKVLEKAIEDKKIDQTALVAIKALLTLYAAIREKFGKKSVIFNESTMYSKSAMTAVMNNLSGINYESAKSLYEALKTFYITDSGRIEFVKNTLMCAKKRIEDETGCSTR